MSDKNKTQTQVTVSSSTQVVAGMTTMLFAASAVIAVFLTWALVK